jgi:phosphate transport system permease protein
MNGVELRATNTTARLQSGSAEVHRRQDRARRADRTATIAVWGVAMTGLGLLGFIVVAICWKGLLTAINPRFVFGMPKSMGVGGGILPMVVSSFYLAVLTSIIVLPVGVGAAVYMAEYSRVGLTTRTVRFGADVLTTVPSIVFGVFGLVLFVTYMGLGYSLLAGALVLSLLNLPTVMRVAEEAILAVPNSYREASMGLGASRWYTFKKVILPSAVPGITTGAIITLGRIVGESAAIVYTVGIVTSRVPWSPLQAGAPMAGNIYHLYTEGGLTPDWLKIATGEAALLLLIVLAFNLLARLVAWLYKRKTRTAARFV